MPRKARIYCESKIYHIILRGNNRRNIFLDQDDFINFLSILQKYKKEYELEIYAYCLMDNHVHLLMKEGNEPLSDTMKRIGVKFVRWYNRKYERTGFLFEERFRSEPVENSGYFLTVFRYIHQNPVKALMVSKAEDYPWSSYHEYAANLPTLVDDYLVKGYYNNTADLLDFLNSQNKDTCLEYYADNRVPDVEAIRLIKSALGIKNIDDILKMSDAEVSSCILEINQLGLSLRQIRRLTGLSLRKIKESLRDGLFSEFAPN